MSNKTQKTGSNSVKVIEQKSKKTKKKNYKKRVQRPKRNLVPPFIKQIFMFLVKLFLLLTVSVLTAWLGVEFTKEFQYQRQVQIELKAKQINEIHELELNFNQNQLSVAFYVEETNESGEAALKLVELPISHFTFHQREEFPYPYVRVVCETNETCALGEAKALELYFDPTDFHAINIH